MSEATFLLAQQALRLSTGYDWLMLASRVLHVLGAIILVGGLFYLWAVVRPSAANGGTASADQFFGGHRATWAKWVGITSGLLLATGLWNFVQMVKTYEIATSYHMMGGIKILLSLVLMALAALLAGRTAIADTIRQKWRLWLSLTLIIGVLIVAVGGIMRTYKREEKIPQSVTPTPVAR